MHTPRNIQSPYTATDFWNRWSSVNPRMALFIKATPVLAFGDPSALTVGLTSNTRDMVLPGHSGVTFKSAAGMIPSEISQAFGETVTMEFQGLYTAGIFTAEQVMLGVWNNAFIEIFSSPWDNPNLGELLMFTGNLGELEHHGSYFKGEVRGLAGRLSQDVGPVTSRACRVPFRSTECGFSAKYITVNSVSIPTELDFVIGFSGSFESRSKLDLRWDSGGTLLDGNGAAYTGNIPPTGFFDSGSVTVGAITREILTWEFEPDPGDATQGQIRMQFKRPFPFKVGSGDIFSIKNGCTKRVEDCQKYNNIANFRGEPYVPGIAVVNRVPIPEVINY